MAVMAREAWTDERLDDLNKKVDGGFNDMRAEFRATRQEMAAGRDQTAAMQRSFNQMAMGLIGTMLVGFLGVIATILTQV
jgi:hypothetical protein